MPESSILSATDIVKDFKTQRALDRCSFDVREGEVVVIIGPSGSGKSTLLRCLNLIEVPNEGTLRLGDEDVLSMPQDGLGRKRHSNIVRARTTLTGSTSMVFQKFNLFPHMTVLDNVAAAPHFVGSVPMELARTTAMDLLERVGLADRQSAFPAQLSGGQQQRLCIARALAVNPDVLLMDEPCSALDPIATARIEDLMAEIKSEYPIIIVTHNMQQAARVSDRTAFFNTEIGANATRPTGVLVEYDATRKIFSAPSDVRTEQYISGKMG